MTTCDDHPGICNFCGASIFWAVTAKHGKCMPLDLEPNPAGNVILDDDGLARVFRRGYALLQEEPTYMPHKASCERWGVLS